MYDINGKLFDLQCNLTEKRLKAKLDEFQPILDCLKRIDSTEFNTVIDIGANIGFSAIAFYAYCPNARIYAFEPIPDTFAMLNDTITVNNLHARINAAPMAVTGKESNETVVIFDSIEVAGQHIAKGTPHTVAAININHLCSKFDYIDLMKIDIEGDEHELFDSLTAESLNRIGYIWLEEHYMHYGDHINPMVKLGRELDLRDWLHAHNYDIIASSRHGNEGYLWSKR